MQFCYLELILSVIQREGAPCYGNRLYIPQVVQALSALLHNI